MAISPRSLVVKKSTIPGSGNGLFTKIFIPAGTRIIEYKGKVTTWKDADHEDGDNAYIYFVKRTHVIDARKNKKWLARYANDAKGLTRVKGITNNCEYVEDASHVYIHAKKDIPAGAEILVPYGPEYWQVIRYNIRLAEKQKQEASKVKTSTGIASKASGSTTSRNKVSGNKVSGNKVSDNKVSGNKVSGNKVSSNKVSGNKASDKKNSVTRSSRKLVTTAIDQTEEKEETTKKTTSGKGSPTLVQNFPLPPAKTHRTVRTREKQSQ